MLSMTYWPISPGQSTRHPKVISDLISKFVDLTVVTSHVSTTSNLSLSVEYKGGIKIVRVPTINIKNRSFFWQAIKNLSFPFACLLVMRHVPKRSIIFSAGPNPTFFAFTCPLLRFIKSSRYLALLTDMYPDAAFDAGFMSNYPRFLQRTVTAFCLRAYKNCDHIMVITSSLKDRLIEYGIQGNKITVVELAVDTSVFRSLDNLNVESLGIKNLNGKFIVLYSGSFGVMYDFDMILKAAEILKEKTNIHFIIRGDGDLKSYIQDMKAQKKLENVTILGTVTDIGTIVSFINVASVCIIPIKNWTNSDLTHPSKMFEFLACGKPVLVTSKGETAKLINRSKSGISVSPGDTEAFASAISYLSEHTDIAKDMGTKGRSLVEQEFSYESIRRKFLNVIYSLHMNRE